MYVNTYAHIAAHTLRQIQMGNIFYESMGEEEEHNKEGENEAAETNLQVHFF